MPMDIYSNIRNSSMNTKGWNKRAKYVFHATLISGNIFAKYWIIMENKNNKNDWTIIDIMDNNFEEFFWNHFIRSKRLIFMFYFWWLKILDFDRKVTLKSQDK